MKAATLTVKQRLLNATPPSKTLSVLAVVLALIFSFSTRTVPWPSSDQGIFQSVAYRILPGDRLYADIYDNKDPLFYFMLAAELRGGPFLYYLCETAQILGCACLVAAIARHFHPRLSFATLAMCFLASAYVFTDTSWAAGLPATPGTLLAELAIAAIIWGYPLAAGMALAATFFTNILFVAPAGAFVVTFCLLQPNTRTNLMRVFAAGIGLAVGVIVALMLMGEWTVYLAMLNRNYWYTRVNWQATSTIADSVHAHVFATIRFGGLHMVAWLESVVLLSFAWRRTERGSPIRAACLASLSLFPVLAAQSAATVVLDHHLGPWRMIVFQAIAIGVPILLEAGRRLLAVLATTALVVCMMPLSWAAKPFSNPLHFTLRLRQLRELSPETHLLRTLAGDHPATYARLGSNNDFHHALGTERYRLICPEFQQYEVTDPARLEATLECARSADYVIVDLPTAVTALASPYPLGLAPDQSRASQLAQRWDAFRSRVDRVIPNSARNCLVLGTELRVCRTGAKRFKSGT